MHPTLRHPLHTHRTAVATVALALGLVAGCGGDESADDAVVTDAAQTLPTQPGDSGGGSPSGTPTGVAGDVRTLTVTLEGGGIDVPTQLQAGPYEIEVVNEGGLVQDLTVARDGEEVVSSAPIDPGLTDTVTVTLEPGDYAFSSSSGGDAADAVEVAVTVD